MTRVLVVGPPRSGTTWIGQVLGRSVATRYVHEPDGGYEPFALRAKRGLSMHTALAPGDRAEAYEQLFAGAFAGGRRSTSITGRIARRGFDAASQRDRTAARLRDKPSPQLRLALACARPLGADPAPNVVVKSVHSCCAVEWIANRFAPTVVVVERHPLNVLASWKEYGFGASADIASELADYAKRTWDLDLSASRAPRFAKQVMSLGVLLGALAEAKARHPEWLRAVHEELVADPEQRFRALAAAAGLEFSDDAADYLAESNQQGEGYATRRNRAELREKWRRVLTDDDVQIATEVFARFPDRFGLADALEAREHGGVA